MLDMLLAVGAIILAGMVLAGEQQLTTGTWIELDDQVGRIEGTGWRSMIIQTRLLRFVRGPDS